MKNFKKSLKMQPLVFKRWMKKSYAAFSSVGKAVTIASLNIAYFGSLGVASAQENNEGKPTISKEINLDEVEVVADVSPQLASEAARVVEVITQKEIQEASAQSVNELLEFALGVDIRQRGRHGIQADLSVRGGTFDQVMVLLNGVNITDPQTGHFNLNLPVSIESVERIEILEGPGARYWGPNAFSGAINFVTKEVDKTQVGVGLLAGQNGFLSGQADAGFTHGNFKHYVFLGGKKSDGYIANADYDTYNIYYNVSHHSKLGKATAQFGYTDKAFGANTFYTPLYPYQYEQNKTSFGSIKFETSGNKLKFSPQVYFRQNHDRFELYREDGYFEKTTDGYRVMNTDTAPAWYGGHNYHTTTIMGGEMNGRYYSELGITSFGINLRNEHIYSNVLGSPMNETRNVPREPDGVFTKSAERLNTGFFVEHFYSYQNFRGSVGAMANHNTFDHSFGVYPGIDVAADISKHLAWYGSANASFRMPTFTDLYYNGPRNVGNPDLKAEKAETFETGFKYKAKGIKWHGATFVRYGHDLIDWVQVNAGDAKFTTVNHNAAKTFGVESSLQWSPRVHLGPKCIFTKLKLTYGYLDSEIDLKGLQSAYVGDYLKHKFTAQISHKLAGNLSAHWGFRFQDREGQYEKYDGLASAGFVNYDPFWLTDLKLMWTKPKYRLYVEATNLFDTKYVDFGNVAQPGLWVIGGIKVLLK